MPTHFLKTIRTFLIITLSISVLFIGILEGLLYQFGETLPLGTVIRYQEKTNGLFGTRYINIPLAYKIKLYQRHPADIVTFGSSRIMLVRPTYFSSGHSFLNEFTTVFEGNSFQGIWTLLHSMKKSRLPKVIFFDIDPWLFSPEFQENRTSAKQKLINSFPVLGKFRHIYRTLKNHMNAYTVFLDDKDDVFPYLFRKTQGMGLNARMLGTGIRLDGSYQLPKKIERKPLKTLEEWQKDLLNPSSQLFGPYAHLDAAAVRRFERILDFCKTNNIEVIGLLLPFRPDLYAAMTQVKPYNAYFEEYRTKVPALLKKRGYLSYDFLNPASLQLTEKDFYDQDHYYPYVIKRIMKAVQRDYNSRKKKYF